ncbi:MAG: hypothetical protein ABL863_12460, partial [Nitrosomonas sp.]
MFPDRSSVKLMAIEQVLPPVLHALPFTNPYISLSDQINLSLVVHMLGLSLQHNCSDDYAGILL